MRTMAVFVVISVIVACSMEVFAIDCSTVSLESIRNCNECIRCGGNWCNKGEKQPCTSQVNDNWCPGQNSKEWPPSLPERSVPGEEISPREYENTAVVGRGPRVTFTYSAPAVDADALSELRPYVTVVNTTQTTNFRVKESDTECENGVCKTFLTITPETSFCRDDGGKYEFLNLRLRVDNVTEQPSLKYHVPCACACSDNVQLEAPICNGHGDFSCGVCSCHKGWSGEFCDHKTKCGNRRGDLQCTNLYKNEVTCSGNGVCGECDKCICNEFGEGWQYFDEKEYCADLGLIITNECEACLLDHTVEDARCTDCDAIVRPCNATLLQDRDYLNRTVWVRFSDSDGTVFAAMKEEGQIYIMRLSSCKDLSAYVAGKVDVTVPAVLGVIAVLATVAAAAGYAVWRARAAPVPLNASQYQELEAPENSAGINPLYKPPTSSYNNPLWKGAKV